MLHLHLLLFLVAHLFLERDLYTSGLKEYDYAKYNRVSYQEAYTVAEFWGIEDPVQSKSLMHLCKLYVVCESRVYCTNMISQAAANTLSLEIHIAHLLVQLPAGRE